MSRAEFLVSQWCQTVLEAKKGFAGKEGIENKGCTRWETPGHISAVQNATKDAMGIWGRGEWSLKEVGVNFGGFVNFHLLLKPGWSVKVLIHHKSYPD